MKKPLPPETLIDVKATKGDEVRVKEMTYAEFLEKLRERKFNGWHLQAYQKGIIKK